MAVWTGSMKSLGRTLGLVQDCGNSSVLAMELPQSLAISMAKLFMTNCSSFFEAKIEANNLLDILLHYCLGDIELFVGLQTDRQRLPFIMVE